MNTNSLRQVLGHLSDLAYLEMHPLAKSLDILTSDTGLTRGATLRRALHLGIESLEKIRKPGSGVVVSSSYDILRQHYILDRSMLDIANELNLTERHAYRLLRRAVLALAQILEERNWFQATQALPPGTALPHDAAAADDLDMLVPTHRDGVDLVNLVNTVVQDIRSLATPKGITISGPNQRFAIRVIINRVMLRQALVNLLSTVVQAQEEGTVEVGVHAVPHRVIVRVRCEAPPELVSRLDGTPSSVASRLLAALDIFPSYQRLSPREIVCDIPIPLTEKLAVLLIDDNVGLLALFTRYLALGPYLVRGASSAEEGMAIANDWHPDIIILDVMMPDRDGWEVIRHLRRTEAGKEAHIIICSVVNDPELAIALGADGFLPKPVTRAALLAALPSDRRHRI